MSIDIRATSSAWPERNCAKRGLGQQSSAVRRTVATEKVQKTQINSGRIETSALGKARTSLRRKLVLASLDLEQKGKSRVSAHSRFH